MAWIDRDSFGFLGRLFQFRSVRPDLDAEVDAEIDYHLERAESELMEQGMSRSQARREAQRRFGDIQRHRRRLLRINRRRGRRQRMIAFFQSIADSVRHAARSLRASPGVTFTVVATLALGIGANATMFGVVDRLLLRAPAHIQDPERVVRLYVERQFIDRRVTNRSITYLDFMDWKAADAFSSTAAIGGTFADEPNMTIGHGDGAERVVAHRATPS
ncbi:MAG: permease prefix domain 1-containing protein, partial [Acidobacteriota bacterium]